MVSLATIRIVITPWMYGVMATLAFVGLLAVSLSYGRKVGLSYRRTVEIVFYATLSGIVGAKVLELFIHFPDYSESLTAFQTLFRSGGVIQGGVVAALLFLVIYSRTHRISPWLLFDILALGCGVGHAVSRIGCVFAGCCFGTECSQVAWALVYEAPGGVGPAGPPLGVPLHPTQIYNSVMAVLILFVMMAIFPRRRFDGQVGLVGLSLYSLGRFVTDFYRDGATVVRLGGGLTVGQIIAVLTLFGCVYFLHSPSKRPRLSRPKLAPETGAARLRGSRKRSAAPR